MFKFNLVSQNVNLDFLKVKNIAFLFSIMLIIFTVFFILYKGLNFGIDFKGGVLIELRDKSNSSVQLSEFRKIDPNIDENVYKILSIQNSVNIRTSYGGTSPSEVKKRIKEWKKKLK